jgi:hypothetical protein
MGFSTSQGLSTTVLRQGLYGKITQNKNALKYFTWKVVLLVTFGLFVYAKVVLKTSSDIISFLS